jgi:hypothetical protein
MKVSRTLMVFGLIVAFAGCATPKPKYDWGQYDPSLYAYYKNPSRVTELSESLESIIETANSKGAMVPPGIYAEYGYLQLEQGKSQEAMQFFKLEEAHWPESRVFMDRMINVASRSSKAPAAQSVAQ